MRKPIPNFIYVLHIKNATQAADQTEIALANGAGGIFLISHGGDYKLVNHSYELIREKFPTAWIGINYLDLDPDRAIIALPDGVDGLWFDDAYIHESTNIFELQDADRLASIVSANDTWSSFASVAFKYQSHVVNVTRIAQRAAESHHVVVTSGEATGSPPSYSKLGKMKLGAGDKPLALASGASIENVEKFSDFVSVFMVSSSVNRSFHEVDPDKIKAFASAIHSATRDCGLRLPQE